MGSSWHHECNPSSRCSGLRSSWWRLGVAFVLPSNPMGLTPLLPRPLPLFLSVEFCSNSLDGGEFWSWYIHLLLLYLWVLPDPLEKLWTHPLQSPLWPACPCLPKSSAHYLLLIVSSETLLHSSPGQEPVQNNDWFFCFSSMLLWFDGRNSVTIGLSYRPKDMQL